ncbi:F-box/FBD/LRR-repeat protein At1g13570-like [Rutidosis leptorrhynchoides]|uniref:F-box/FBD/LRR-repeat protein At1g13570-like n=1 Tax=Rutidosis leptorrhynchoides TaxID=125765 RepID=UPI003A99DD22
MVAEFDLIILYLSRRTYVKDLIIDNVNDSSNFYKLPTPFFSMQGLESICLKNCNFEPPVTFNGFNKLRSVSFEKVQVSAKALQHFLSNSPLLEDMYLMDDNVKLPNQATSMKFVDLLDDSSLTFDHLKHFETAISSDNGFMIEFVKLIIAKSPMLEIARIDVNDYVSVEEELKICKAIINLPFPHASPSLKLFIGL